MRGWSHVTTESVFPRKYESERCGWSASTGLSTANEIATGVNWTPDSRSVYRITTVLKQLGYTRARRAHKWVWLPPGGGEQLEL